MTGLKTYLIVLACWQLAKLKVNIDERYWLSGLINLLILGPAAYYAAVL
jgi:hypothetical protein